jgi:hypothetical protein
MKIKNYKWMLKFGIKKMKNELSKKRSPVATLCHTMLVQLAHDDVDDVDDVVVLVQLVHDDFDDVFNVVVVFSVFSVDVELVHDDVDDFVHKCGDF